MATKWLGGLVWNKSLSFPESLINFQPNQLSGDERDHKTAALLGVLFFPWTRALLSSGSSTAVTLTTASFIISAPINFN